MHAKRPNRFRASESGVALLISIFVLLLICVVAIALIVASGTESALAGNYRSATGVYYAALAGLEEGRGRLLPRNPDYYPNTAPSFLPAPGTPLAIGQVRYIINPVGSENVLTTYPDTEYDKEFGSGALAAATVQTINSVSTVAGIQGPLYKWVRINAVTEQALGIDVDGFHTPPPLEQFTPLFYDGSHLNLTSTGSQALEITSLAVLPNGTQKILQYIVAPNAISLPPFPAAVTLVGTDVDYTGPNSNSWFVSGIDSINLGTCSHGSGVWAVGYSQNLPDASQTNVISGTMTTHSGNYTGQGSGGVTPNAGYIGSSIPGNFQTPTGLDSVVQSITQNADAVIPGPAKGSNLPGSMSASNLMTVVVNGDLDLTSWHHTGYGLLLVTGQLTYDPDASWYGIVMVIGQGLVRGSHAGTGQFVGAMFVAKTRDSSGNLAPGPGMPDALDGNIEFDPAMGGQGIFYSSCWINAARPTGNYQTLSFHEISQP